MATPEKRSPELGMAGSIAKAFINSKLTPLIILFAIGIGAFATLQLPREEEPQIIVPMVDVFVQMPGASAREVEERVTKPMEKLLWEIPGVEYIYSTSSPGMSLAIVRFYVGENAEDAIVRLNQKMLSNFDRIPPGASQPLVKPRSIDDVPILALTLHSERYGDYELRRVAAQLHDAVTQVDQVSAVELSGGQRRRVLVQLDESRLAGFGLAASEVAGMLARANQSLDAGAFDAGNRRVLLETGQFLTTTEDVKSVVVGVHDGRAVYLRDVAQVRDEGEEPTQYVAYASKSAGGFVPAVTLSIS
jgi:multidrug efflux pump subunit AcrB